MRLSVQEDTFMAHDVSTFSELFTRRFCHTKADGNNYIDSEVELARQTAEQMHLVSHTVTGADCA